MAVVCSAACEPRNLRARVRRAALCGRKPSTLRLQPSSRQIVERCRPGRRAISPLPWPISIRPDNRHVSSCVSWFCPCPMATPDMAGVALGVRVAARASCLALCRGLFGANGHCGGGGEANRIGRGGTVGAGGCGRGEMSREAYFEIYL